MNKTHLRSAFSMMEIMVVIFIIGLLGSMMMPRIVKFMRGGQRGATQSSVIGIKNAIISYKMDTGRYPKTLDDLMNNNNVPRWDGPYLQKLDDDPWGNEYIYNKPAREFTDQYKVFEVFSFGSDDAEDTPKEKWLHAGS